MQSSNWWVKRAPIVVLVGLVAVVVGRGFTQQPQPLQIPPDVTPSIPHD